MQVFVACLKGDSKFEGFGEIVEYTRDRKQGSFSRDGKPLPPQKCRKLLLPGSVFKLEMKDKISIKIIDEDEYFRCPSIVEFYDYTESGLCWVVELR